MNLPFSLVNINHDISLPHPLPRKVFWYGFFRRNYHGRSVVLASLKAPPHRLSGSASGTKSL
jgi:hypothetical protein